MLRFSLSQILLIIYFWGFSQDSRITALVKQKEIKTDYYEMAEVGSKILYLQMEYGKPDFTADQQQAIKRLENTIIARIDLVYSDYPSSQDFSPLTKKRFENLQKILPGVFKNPSIQFRKVRQTIGKTKDVAASLVHGFFIYFRPMPTKVSPKKEVEKLKTLLMPSEVESSKIWERDMPKHDSSSDTSVVFWCWTMTIAIDSIYFPPMTEGTSRTVTKISLKEAIKRDYIEKENEKDYLPFGDSVYLVEDLKDEECMTAGDGYFFYDFADSTVSTVFKRNKWGRPFIIADVTGSMYPYTAQLLKWLKLNLTDKEKKYFLFFNDGDNKEDKDKVIGKTGGIYSVLTNNYDEVEKTIEKAMLNGGGGDAPENNIEALLESEKVCDNCDSIVMIVDNWAAIKDISLLEKFHKPVKVVVCGVLGSINKDYLKLVRETKGSLHLIEEDIYNLSEMKEGETVKIHGSVYRLIKGDFVEVSSL